MIWLYQRFVINIDIRYFLQGTGFTNAFINSIPARNGDQKHKYLQNLLTGFVLFFNFIKILLISSSKFLYHSNRVISVDYLYGFISEHNSYHWHACLSSFKNVYFILANISFILSINPLLQPNHLKSSYTYLLCWYYEANIIFLR